MSSTSDLNDYESPAGEAFPAEYLIRVQGCLEGPGWADWFGPLLVSVDLERGETTLQGLVTDQAALYGVLSKLRDLTLTLLLVERLDASAGPAGPAAG
jgi:hypothetical protein